MLLFLLKPITFSKSTDNENTYKLLSKGKVGIIITLFQRKLIAKVQFDKRVPIRLCWYRKYRSSPRVKYFLQWSWCIDLIPSTPSTVLTTDTETSIKCVFDAKFLCWGWTEGILKAFPGVFPSKRCVLKYYIVVWIINFWTFFLKVYYRMTIIMNGFRNSGYCRIELI